MSCLENDSTNSGPSPSREVAFDEYSQFGYALEPEYTEEELHEMEAAESSRKYKRHRGRAPDVLTHSQSRLMAYRQFVCWVRKGQPLGKRNRVTIPACVVNIIREAFPSQDGVYEGFNECESDTSDSE